MVLILISWLYSFGISLGMGMLISKIAKWKFPLFYTLSIGLLGELIFLSTVAFFLPIAEIVYGIQTILAGFGLIWTRKTWIPVLQSSWKNWKEWKSPIRTLSGILFFFILMQSATKPYMGDNETYYVQTIQWLNQYGLVKGLGNLHIFFAQTSGWHILQSGLNFGFVSHSLNDVNGFLLIMATFLWLFHLNKFFSSQITMDLFLGLMPFLNLIFFQFVSAPSPDLPIFIFSQIIFYLFYKNYNSYQGDFKLILLLTVFLILIKITVAPLILLSIVLMIKQKIWTKELPFFLGVGFLSISLFCLKNYTLSGYLFYPTDFLGGLTNPDWKIPKEIQNAFKPAPFAILSSISAQEAAKLSLWEFFKLWILEPGPRAIFNKLIILLLLVFPIYIWKNKTLFWLYIYALCQFLLLFFTAPFYRFFLPLIIGMMVYMLAKFFLNQKKGILVFLFVTSLIPVTALFVPISLKNLKTYPNSAESIHPFDFKNSIIPPKNSGKNLSYKTKMEGNLQFQTPINENPNFWFLTGDGPLPCVHENLIIFWKKTFQMRPQMRTEFLKDGFKSEKIKE